MSSSVVSKLPFNLNFVKNLVKCIFKERDTINFKNLSFLKEQQEGFPLVIYEAANFPLMDSLASCLILFFQSETPQNQLVLIRSILTILRETDIIFILTYEVFVCKKAILVGRSTTLQ